MSGEQGERFHQDIALMEQRYQGFGYEDMLASYYWMVYGDAPEKNHERKLSFKLFFTEIQQSVFYLYFLCSNFYFAWYKAELVFLTPYMDTLYVPCMLKQH